MNLMLFLHLKYPAHLPFQAMTHPRHGAAPPILTTLAPPILTTLAHIDMTSFSIPATLFLCHHFYKVSTYLPLSFTYMICIRHNIKAPFTEIQDGSMRGETENSSQNHRQCKNMVNTTNPKTATGKKVAPDCIQTSQTEQTT